MEQIKRANNLWSSDNLSLRSRTVISVPVLKTETTIESPLYSSCSTTSTTSSPTTSPKDSTMPVNNSSNSLSVDNHSSLESIDITSEETNRAVSQSSLRSDPNQTKAKLKNGFKKESIVVPNENQSNHLDSCELNEETDESAADFLIRIDSSIAKTKDKVKVMQQNRLTGTHSDDDLFRLNHLAHRSGLRRHHSNSARPHSANSGPTQRQTHTDFPQPLVMMSHKKKVKSSLKRLEKTQDEIFELWTTRRGDSRQNSRHDRRHYLRFHITIRY